MFSAKSVVTLFSKVTFSLCSCWGAVKLDLLDADCVGSVSWRVLCLCFEDKIWGCSMTMSLDAQQAVLGYSQEEHTGGKF